MIAGSRPLQCGTIRRIDRKDRRRCLGRPTQLASLTAPGLGDLAPRQVGVSDAMLPVLVIHRAPDPPDMDADVAPVVAACAAPEPADLLGHARPLRQADRQGRCWPSHADESLAELTGRRRAVGRLAARVQVIASSLTEALGGAERRSLTATGQTGMPLLSG